MPPPVPAVVGRRPSDVCRSARTAATAANLPSPERTAVQLIEPSMRESRISHQTAFGAQQRGAERAWAAASRLRPGRSPVCSLGAVHKAHCFPPLSCTPHAHAAATKEGTDVSVAGPVTRARCVALWALSHAWRRRRRGLQDPSRPAAPITALDHSSPLSAHCSSPTAALLPAGPATHFTLAALDLRPCEHQVWARAGAALWGFGGGRSAAAAQLTARPAPTPPPWPCPLAHRSRATCLRVRDCSRGWMGCPPVRWRAAVAAGCRPAAACCLAVGRPPCACPPLLPADGKAGSLVDGRGHFYKPLQKGPRGDRERAFYDAVANTLQAEVAAGSSPAAAAAALASTDCSPVAVRDGVTVAAAAAALASGPGSPEGGSAAASPHALLPWRQRQLRRLFPSFKDAGERGPMAITQVRRCRARWGCAALEWAACAGMRAAACWR